MKWKLIEEAKTPSDMKSIEASFNKDVSDEKFIPTVEFIEAVYKKLNEELFFNYLPGTKDVEFSLSDDIRGDELGAAECTINYARNRIWASDYKLSLDKTAKITLHSWIGTVLHEMIHLLEYQEHPENKQNSDYNWHGEWFRRWGDKFKKYGFDLSEFYTGDFEVDADDERVGKIMEDELFIQLGKTKKGIPQAIKILKSEKSRCLEFLKKMGIDEVTLLHTDNPLSIKVLPTTIKELESTSLTVHHINDDFNKMFGPFTEVETIDLNTLVLEDSDGYDEEVERIRHQKGVVDAYRLSPTAIRIVVS